LGAFETHKKIMAPMNNDNLHVYYHLQNFLTHFFFWTWLHEILNFKFFFKFFDCHISQTILRLNCAVKVHGSPWNSMQPSQICTHSNPSSEHTEASRWSWKTNQQLPILSRKLIVASFFNLEDFRCLTINV
jgi:hypothetical protein